MKFLNQSFFGPTFTINTPAGDVPCPAGSATQLFSNPTSAPTKGGKYWILVIANIVVQFGAAIPTALNVTFGAGTITHGHNLEVGAMVANATIVWPIVETLDYSVTPFTGQNFLAQCNPTTNAVTIKRSAVGFGTQVLAIFNRFPDVGF